jgi:hypothetical protein
MEQCACLCSRDHPNQEVPCDAGRPEASVTVESVIFGPVAVHVCWPCYFARKAVYQTGPSGR